MDILFFFKYTTNKIHEKMHVKSILQQSDTTISIVILIVSIHIQAQVY
jgi:hypothetical protein